MNTPKKATVFSIKFGRHWKEKSIKYLVLHIFARASMFANWLLEYFLSIFSIWCVLVGGSPYLYPDQRRNFPFHLLKKVEENIWKLVFDGWQMKRHTHTGRDREFSFYYFLNILFALTGKCEFFFHFAGNTQKYIK